MNWLDWLNIACKIATVVIALVNIVFVIIIFRRNRHRELVKTLILDYSIKHLYQYFEDLEKELSKLKKECDIPTKQKIDKNIISIGLLFEQRFIDLFLSINPPLHKKIKNKIDDMVGDIEKSIFDAGINIYVETQYNEKIANVVINTKASLIKLLYDESK